MCVDAGCGAARWRRASSTMTSPASRGAASALTQDAGRVPGGRTGNALETLLDAKVTCASTARASKNKQPGLKAPWGARAGEGGGVMVCDFTKMV